MRDEGCVDVCVCACLPACGRQKKKLNLHNATFSLHHFPLVAGKTHGAPADDNRMVGDLGNIFVDDSGSATVALTDPQVQLLGPHSVIGRSIVVYAGEDDQGRGGHENSVTTGNSGPRIAAGVIGLSAQ